MFTRLYKVAIDGRNSEEAVQSIWSTLDQYGKVQSIMDCPIVQTANPEEVVCTTIVFELKAKPRKFKKLLDVFEDSGHPLKEIRGCWFM